MKLRSNAVVLAALAACIAQAQDVSLYSTTMAQMWKQDTPGFDKNTYAPATEFLGIDVSKVGTDALSLHIFGWGQADLADQSNPGGKTSGYLSSAYAQYRFPTANAEIKAGRFAINQGVGIEQVDGVSAKADLVGGFQVSAFGGRPVLYRTVDAVSQKDYEFQRDVLAGARISWRMPKFGELGVDYLQDGTTAAKDLPIPSQVDYSRRQVGIDLKIAPVAAIDLTGRTVLDVAKHPDVLPGHPTPSKTAENDFNLTVKPMEQLSFTAAYVERNFFAFFAGTNLPSLFRQDERDQFKATSGSVIWGSAASLQVVADYKHTDRLSYGATNRFGADVRWAMEGSKLRTGFGIHKVSADDVIQVSSLVPTYSLSYSEYRAWVMYDKGLLSASLDGILQSFNDKNNPNLNGKSTMYEVVGSLGYQVTPNLRVSGDLSLGANPLATKEVMGLLRAEYRFGTTSKGGSK
jgi:hypothetical protein